MGFPHDKNDIPGVRPEDAPADTVDRLRAEIERLRAEARSAALIEQAKGALAERLGCGVDAAYAHLLQLARDGDLAPLAAAELLLTQDSRSDAAPPAPRTPGDDTLGRAGGTDGAGRADDRGTGRERDVPERPRARRATPAGPAPAGAGEAVGGGDTAGAGDAGGGGDAGGPGDAAVQFERAQRLGNLGWSVWYPATGRIHWSDQVYVIFGRDPDEDPIPLNRLTELVVPEDVPLAAHLIGTLLDGRDGVDNEVRIRRGEEIRELRLIGEPEVDPLGRPVAVRCVYQDVSGWRRGQRALKASRTLLERLRVDEERHQAIEMQRSVLPLPEGIVDKPGLRAAVRYLPAGSLSRVGGDWYETSAIDGEGVFLAIGDVSGHGLRAAAAMARLRNGLSGLAFTGAPPDRLLRWLNKLTLHWPTSLTATVLAGRFDPATRTLTWAQGGHFPPVLIRDGKATTLAQPEGVLLGAVPEPEFGVETTLLEPGDVLLLYTDGLVERRDRDLQSGLDLLVRVASAVGSTDPDAVLDRVLKAFDAPNPNDDTCVVAIQIQ